MAGRTVSLGEVMSAARARKAPLAPESAGYLALAVADLVARSPATVDAPDVDLDEDGNVRLARAPSGPETDVERSVRELLGRLLASAGASTPSLADVASAVEERGVPRLVQELEAALIPVNRAAAKRALARLFRETERTRPHDVAPRAPSRSVPPERLPEVAAVAPEPEPPDTSIDAPVEADPTPTPSVAVAEISMPIDARFDPTVAPPRVNAAVVADDPPPGPPSSTVSFVSDIPAESEKPKAAPLVLLMVLLGLGIAATIAVWVLFPQFFTGHAR